MYYSWENINFSVPLKSSEKALLEQQSKQPQEEDLTKLSKADLQLAIIKKKSQARIMLNKANPELK